MANFRMNWIWFTTWTWTCLRAKLWGKVNKVPQKEISLENQYFFSCWIIQLLSLNKVYQKTMFISIEKQYFRGRNKSVHSLIYLTAWQLGLHTQEFPIFLSMPLASISVYHKQACDLRWLTDWLLLDCNKDPLIKLPPNTYYICWFCDCWH